MSESISTSASSESAGGGGGHGATVGGRGVTRDHPPRVMPGEADECEPLRMPRDGHRLVQYAERLTIMRAVFSIAAVTIALTVGAAALGRLVEPETFHSFGEASWWALQTVSTVGYGDIGARVRRRARDRGRRSCSSASPSSLPSRRSSSRSSSPRSSSARARGLRRSWQLAGTPRASRGPGERGPSVTTKVAPGVRGAIESHLGSAQVPRVIYGAIIGLALVVSLEDHPPRAGVMAGFHPRDGARGRPRRDLQRHHRHGDAHPRPGRDRAQAEHREGVGRGRLRDRLPGGLLRARVRGRASRPTRPSRSRSGPGSG